MNETIWLMVGGVLGAALQHVVGPLITSLFSRTKDRAALSELFLKLEDMSADQLQERFNMIVSLNATVFDLQEENRALRKKQAERDEELTALHSQVSGLQGQINLDAAERSSLREKLAQLDTKNRVLWQYLIASLEHGKRHGVRPIDPPAELKSDPEIIRIIKEVGGEETQQG